MGSSAKGRKRKRKVYDPNKREQQAELRHSKVAPWLKSAFEGFAAWFQTCEGLTVQETLLQCQSQQLGSQIHSEATEATEATCRNDKTEKLHHEGTLGSKSFISQGTAFTDAIRSESNSQREMQRGDKGSNGCPHKEMGRDEGQELDLLALADLQSLVKPKFTFHGEAERTFNLFNCHISNTALDEKEADAHESQVIIPGSCSFFMADMSKFRALLKGKTCRLYRSAFLNIFKNSLQDDQILLQLTCMVSRQTG